MSWFFIALGAPALWALSNHIDKYLIHKYFRGQGSGALILFSAMSGIVVLAVAPWISPDIFNISAVNIAVILFSGASSILALIPYFYAMERDEASIVVPIFQFIPLFNYLLGYLFLGETISGGQLLGMFLILFGSIGLTLDFSSGRIAIKKQVLFPILLSCLLFSLGSVLYKGVVIEASFWITKFWEYLGSVIVSLLFFLGIPLYRRQFLSLLKNHTFSLLGLNAFNEIINIIAWLLMSYAMLLVPLALASSVNGFQPVFVLLLGILITLFFPKMVPEKLAFRSMFQKIVTIGIIALGALLLNQ